MQGTVEETVALAGHEIRIERPRDAEALLDEEAFEHEEFLPYWAELWPSSRALARAVLAHTLRGRSTLELGCGLGLPSIAAALAGGRVVATDWSTESIAYTEANARHNDVSVETLVCAWAQPAPLVERGPWSLVLASDVLYERRNVDELLILLPQLVTTGEVWIADPGRATAEAFVVRAAETWEIESRRDAKQPVTVHRLRRRATET
jgi:predicted nicotinamide N-methyase